MKKTLYTLLLCGLSLLLFASCEKENGKSYTGRDSKPAATMKGVFYAAVQNADETIKIMPGKSKSAQAQVCVFESSVSDVTLNISFKVAPDGLAVYNAAHPGEQAQLLPSSAYEFVSNNMILARFNKASTYAKLRIIASGLENDVLYVLPITIDKVEGTDLWGLAEQPYGFIKAIQTIEGPEGGDGSMEFPFELRTVEDMLAIGDNLVSGDKTYFKMMNDIDMSEMPTKEIDDPDNPGSKIKVPTKWVPLNNKSPYLKAIDFDGQGHTISNFYCDYDEGDYPSFFGVLNGYCHDVTFLNAKVVVKTAQRDGILAGYCGLQDASKGVRGDCARVHIQGELDHRLSSKYGAGGFFGFMGTGALYACSADVDIKSKLNNVGGLAGYCGKEVEIIDCWTSGIIRGGQRVGGILGGTVGDDDPTVPIKIVNCYSTAKVYGSFGIGGIGGYFTKATANPTGVDPGNIFENCIAWNEEIHANWNVNTEVFGEITSGDVSHYSCGAVIGYCAVKNTLKGNVRNPAMAYNSVIFFDYTDAFSLYDQPDTSPETPLSPIPVAGANYNYPYHGTAAPAGKTLSEVAQSLGWSSAIWDFSAELPKLRPDAQVGPVPDVSAGGQLPGFENNDL
jgi:hypothetical protein